MTSILIFAVSDVTFQLSGELGVKIYPKSSLTFSKCLEMKLQDRIDVIAKVGEVAGKEYSIEQVRRFIAIIRRLLGIFYRTVAAIMMQLTSPYPVISDIDIPVTYQQVLFYTYPEHFWISLQARN